MARKSLELKRIEARQAQLAVELASIEQVFTAKVAEQKDLEIAKRVIEQLSGPTLSEPDLPPQPPEPIEPENLEEEPGDGQTIGDLALQVITETGPLGLTSGEILAEIQRRWLPDLARTSLSPPLSRLKKKGEIELEGDRWRLAL